MTPRATKHQKKTAKSQPPADRPFAPGYGIVGQSEGKGLLSWTWVARKLNSCRTFWLTTIHASHGGPHTMPLWGVWLDDAFFFFHRTQIPQRSEPRRQSRLHHYQRRRSRSRNHRRASRRNHRCIGARSHRGGLQEEIQDGSAQYERTNLRRAPNESIRIYREKLSEVSNPMEIVTLRTSEG